MKETEKVIFVCTQMEAGGVQILATELSDIYRSAGLSAKTIFLYIKRPVFQQGENIISMTTNGIKSPIRLLLVIYDLVRIFKTENPDAVIGMAHNASPIAAFAAKIAGIPYRIATQTNPPLSHRGLPVLMDVMSDWLGFYTHNVAASQAIAKCFDNYSASYRQKIQVIHNGITSEPSILNKSTARRKFKIPENAHLAISCGRLSVQKNHRFLLKIAQQMPELTFAILGEGEERNSLEGQIEEMGLKERFILLGEYPPSEVRDFMKCGDIFLFPSLYEAFGLALVEAMASGLPVITSKDPAILEILGGRGVSLELDPVLWSRAIDDISKDMHLRQMHSAALQERSKDFSMTSMAEKFRKIWRDAAR